MGKRIAGMKNQNQVDATHQQEHRDSPHFIARILYQNASGIAGAMRSLQGKAR